MTDQPCTRNPGCQIMDDLGIVSQVASWVNVLAWIARSNVYLFTEVGSCIYLNQITTPYDVHLAVVAVQLALSSQLFGLFHRFLFTCPVGCVTFQFNIGIILTMNHISFGNICSFYQMWLCVNCMVEVKYWHRFCHIKIENQAAWNPSVGMDMALEVDELYSMLEGLRLEVSGFHLRAIRLPQ